jgi:hypothetical protein
MSDPRVAGLGPITVDPSIQDRGVGRKLMEAVLVRARERNFPGVRLLQSAFHNRSLALYSRLGFDAREPVSVVQGPPLRKRIEGCSVRPARAPDLEDCNRLCMQVYGHDRGGELADAIKGGTAVVVERHERITGYTTVLAFFGHAVGETNLDLQALIVSAEAFGGPGIIVPTRNSDPFSLVPRERPSSRPAHDADDLGAVQRASGGASAFRTLLKRSPLRPGPRSTSSILIGWPSIVHEPGAATKSTSNRPSWLESIGGFAEALSGLDFKPDLRRYLRAAK